VSRWGSSPRTGAALSKSTNGSASQTSSMSASATYLTTGSRTCHARTRRTYGAPTVRCQNRSRWGVSWRFGAWSGVPPCMCPVRRRTCTSRRLGSVTVAELHARAAPVWRRKIVARTACLRLDCGMYGAEPAESTTDATVQTVCDLPSGWASVTVTENPGLPSTW